MFGTETKKHENRENTTFFHENFVFFESSKNHNFLETRK